jgi:hypothetical protein
VKVVNFINILCAAFAPIFLRQKSANIEVKYKKLRAKHLYDKAARKMLVKLTPYPHRHTSDSFSAKKRKRKFLPRKAQLRLGCQMRFQHVILFAFIGLFTFFVNFWPKLQIC